MKYRIIVYDWNPNGTNDIAIEGSYSNGDPRCMDSLQEALFGVNIVNLSAETYQRRNWFDSREDNARYITLKQALKHIACSPVSDGSETINFLKKYFRSLK